MKRKFTLKSGIATVNFHKKDNAPDFTTIRSGKMRHNPYLIVLNQSWGLTLEDTNLCK